jgi:hypothetical protein
MSGYLDGRLWTALGAPSLGPSEMWEGVRVVEDSETTMNLRKPLATTPRMLYSSMHMSCQAIWTVGFGRL